MKRLHRIKVLHVAPLPPPLGGMVTYIQGLLNSDVFKVIDYKVVRLNYINKERYKGIFRVIINIVNSSVLTIVFLAKAIYWRPNIVHIQSNSGFGFFEKSWIALLAKMMGCKTLFHFHGGNLRNFYSESSGFVKKMILNCALLNDRIITGSPQMRENWLFIGIPESKIVYIGNAVNLPEIKEKMPNENITILFLTRIVLEKGIIELIDAFLSLKLIIPNVQMRIVGAESLDAPYVKEYLQKKDINQSIKYIGPVTDEEKNYEYLKADIFAFPTYFEDQSYAIMEAMSYELPCVASNVGGVPSLIINGENGILVTPKDVQSLKYALESLCRNPELRQLLGKKARKTIEQGFTWQKRSIQIIELYENLAPRKRL